MKHCTDCFNNDNEFIDAKLKVKVKTFTNSPITRFLCLAHALAWIGRMLDTPSYVEYVKISNIKKEG